MVNVARTWLDALESDSAMLGSWDPYGDGETSSLLSETPQNSDDEAHSISSGICQEWVECRQQLHDALLRMLHRASVGTAIGLSNPWKLDDSQIERLLLSDLLLTDSESDEGA